MTIRIVCLSGLLLAACGVSHARAAILVNAEAIAFQDEGTISVNVADGVSVLDDVWSLIDVAPFGTVTHDYYATGTSSAWFDALSVEFILTAEEMSHLDDLTFRVYLQKGNYSDNAWQHYQILPGLMNDTNEDFSPVNALGAIEHPASLSSDQVVGWVEFSLDATSDANYMPDGNHVDLTFRLWNWRIDAVELAYVPEPGTMIVWGLLGMVAAGYGVWRRRRAG